MPKHIDADEFKEVLKVLAEAGFGRNLNGFMFACFATNVMKKIDDFPTADVEKVRHGKWKSSYSRRGDFTNRFYICSCCDEWFDKDFAQIVTHNVGNKKCGFNYCPNCGAKMDGGKDD